MHELLITTTTTSKDEKSTVTHHDFDEANEVTEVQPSSHATPIDAVLTEETSSKTQHLGQNPNGSSSMGLSPPVLLSPEQHASEQDIRASLTGDRNPYFD